MSRTTKFVIGGVVAALVVAAVVVGVAGSGGSSSKSGDVVILSRVERRTLQSTVALQGTLARKQLRNITAASQGLVSAVHSTDGSTTLAGQSMFALNGRAAVAETGTVAFFRSLAVGDEGADVLQLKQILAAAGDDPGPMTPLFTEQTQFALAQWQAAHGYPNVTPATPQSVTVSLQQGTGYKLGTQVSAGLIIGPPAALTSQRTTTSARRGVVLAGDLTRLTPGPTVTIQSVADQVTEGQPATFVLSASPAPTSDLTIDLAASGTADSQDVVTPPTQVTLPAGQSSTEVSVQTRVDTLVKPTKSLTLTVGASPDYVVGSPSSATTDIANNNVPTLTITGGATVQPGGSVTLTVTASQAPLVDTQVPLSFTGSAVPGTDYTAVDPVVVVPAGGTSASVTVNTLNPNTIEPDRFLTVAISPSPGNYAVGQPGTAVVTIAGASGSSALPTLTLTSATTYLQKGEPYQVSVSLSRAMSSPLTVGLTYAGTAVSGQDYTPPGGQLVVPAGQTTLAVTIPTVTDNLVEADRTLTVGLAPSAAYTIGSPSSASVTITSQVLPVVNITAGAATVTQGGTATFTITANQPVVKATSVSFAVQGTAQPGQDYQPVVGAALLAPGQSQVSVTLDTLRTDVGFEPTDMVVGHWPTRVGTVFVKAGAPVTPGEPILSLTEPDLTVTLQASAANRTLLRVGQSATVQISGADTTSPGTITELDSTPTSVSSGAPGGASSQVYEGRIEVPTLNGADGSQVSITVVNQQVVGAITVPISAVKQDGVGKDVVRVLNRRTGVVTEVRVTTGLSEGSYIQVTGGALRVGQTVISEVDQPQ